MRLEDLPPKLREQALAQLGEPAPKKKDRRGDSRVATDGICWECGEHFTSTTKFEQHSAANPGHRRLELHAHRKDT